VINLSAPAIVECFRMLESMRQVCSRRPNLSKKQNVAYKVGPGQAKRLPKLPVDSIAHNRLATIAKSVIVRIDAHGCRPIKPINCDFEAALDRRFRSSLNQPIPSQSFEHIFSHVIKSAPGLNTDVPLSGPFLNRVHKRRSVAARIATLRKPRRLAAVKILVSHSSPQIKPLPHPITNQLLLLNFFWRAGSQGILCKAVRGRTKKTLEQCAPREHYLITNPQ
jgi:hypothetical protein